tara:strand:- start:973 stop:1302 length:330 start_codon:yes stop_codon:yes gene_type:complete
MPKNNIQQFYFYSHTNQECIIQTEHNNNPAWKLKFSGQLIDNSVDDIDSKDYKKYQNCYFLITTKYSDDKLKKVESRPIKSIFSAINWADFIQDEDPQKTVYIYQIIKN